MPSATYVVAIDWAADSAYTGNDIITGDVIEMSWRCGGRDYASQLVGRSVSGCCTLTVNNADAKYNSFNTSSPLYGNILPGRKVNITMNSEQMFTGFLDIIEPLPSISGIHRAIVRCIGPFSYISQRKISIALQQNITTDVAEGKILDEAGWPAADRAGDGGRRGRVSGGGLRAVQTRGGGGRVAPRRVRGRPVR